MALFTKAANDVFAGYNVDGSARSVSNQETQVWGTEAEALLQSTALAASASVARATKSELDAVVGSYANGDIGLVVLDNNTALRGVYRKQGGIWVKRSNLPADSPQSAIDAQLAADAAAQSAADAAESAQEAAESAVSPPVTAVGLNASRGMMPIGYQSFTLMNSRTRHFARDNILRMQLLFGNWYFATGESPGLGNITVSAAIEYPKGRILPLRWGGSTTVVIAPGDNAPLSDPAFISIPDGAEFWVRTYQSAPSGCVVCDVKDSIGGDQAEYASSGLADKTASGTITDDTNQFYCYGPLAIVGETHKPSVLILGDSRNHGGSSLAHLDAQSNRGNIAHAIGGQFGYMNCSRGGSTLGQFNASHARIEALKTYVTDVVIQYGINDVRGGATNVAARLAATVSYFSGTKKVWPVTIEPDSTSSDGWTTGGGQTTHANNGQRVIYNDAIRAGIAGAAGYFEFADTVETIRNSGLWKISDVGLAITSDGIHLNDVGHRFANAQGAIDPRRIYRYPEPVSRWATREEWEKGEAANKWLSPAMINRSYLYATKSADQTGIAALASVNITWQTLNMNGGRWDASTNRWYPPKGIYRVHSQISVSAGIQDDQIAIMRARKNGTIEMQTEQRTKNTSAFSIDVDRVMEFNGVSDYLSVDINITGSGDKTVAGAPSRTFLEVYAI